MRQQPSTSSEGITATEELWDLTTGHRFVDAAKLRSAVDRLSGLTLDPRTRELVGAAHKALQGETTSCTRFPTLHLRIGTEMKKSTIERYLKDLGSELLEPARIIIGGSSTLILLELLRRNTEDIDLVDEIPLPIRVMHSWRDQAKKRHGLYLAHFQSHYLPRGWEDRVASLGSFRQLTVELVDPLDILVGKLFSKREKDKADLDEVLPFFSRQRVDERLVYADRLATDRELLGQADKNYYVQYGEPLPEIPTF